MMKMNKENVEFVNKLLEEINYSFNKALANKRMHNRSGIKRLKETCNYKIEKLCTEDLDFLDKGREIRKQRTETPQIDIDKIITGISATQRQEILKKQKELENLKVR